MGFKEHINRIILLVSFLLFGQFACYAQSSKTIVQVKVVDEQGNRINDVYLIENSSKAFLGATKNGEVEFATSQNSLVINFSHLAYQQKQVRANNIQDKDTLLLNLVLTGKIFGIGEVSISAEANSLAYQNEVINVMDYEFYNNSILMLCGLGKNKQLRLASGNGYDITSMFLPKGAKAIYKDCLNNIHLLYKDSVYVVQFSDTSLYLVDPYPRSEFEETAALCEAAIGRNLIIARIGDLEQEVNFFLKPEGTTQYDFLKRIVNHKDQAIARNYARVYGDFRDEGTSSASLNTRSSLQGLRNLDRSYTFFKYVLSVPLFAPIYEIEKQFVLFDTYNGVIEWYTPQGIPVQTKKVDFKEQKDWANLLLFDKEQEQVYVFKTDGPKKYVQKLSLESGNLGESINLKKHPFAENYKIKDGYIYYLYREDYQPGLPKKLYKHRL